MQIAPSHLCVSYFSSVLKSLTGMAQNASWHKDKATTGEPGKPTHFHPLL